MNRRLVATVAAVLWLSACAGQPTETGGTSTNQARKNVLIRVTDDSLEPATAEVFAGGTVLWQNYASESSASIVLPTATVEALGCADLRPDFGKVAGGWRSNVLTPNDDRDVRIPCPVPAGEYAYRVNLGRGAFDLDNPQLQLEGRIIAK